jgi:Tfp pilus assembly protein PilO
MRELNKREKIIIATVAIALVVFIVQRLIVEPQSRRLSKARKELASISEQYSSLLPKLAGFKNLRTEVVSKERQLASLEEVLSYKAEPGEIIHEVSRQAQVYGLQLDHLRPQRTTVLRSRAGKAEEFRQLVLNLGIRGRYEQLGEFISSLEEQPFYVKVAELKVERGRERPQLLEIRLQLEIVVRS